MAGAQAQERPVVVFDLGGVLIDWNPRYLYRKLFDDEAAMERFLARSATAPGTWSRTAAAPSPTRSRRRRCATRTSAR